MKKDDDELDELNEAFTDNNDGQAMDVADDNTTAHSSYQVHGPCNAASCTP